MLYELFIDEKSTIQLNSPLTNPLFQFLKINERVELKMSDSKLQSTTGSSQI